jgi:transposase
VDLFEEIRREYEFGTGTIAGMARKFGVHRRLIREALASAIPRETVGRARPKPRVEPAAAFIAAILEADRQAPRKQRRTAHRIYVRLTKERPDLPIAESTVRRHVRQRKDALGLLERETFVPQHYAYGVEAQVDWYEAAAEVGGQRETFQVFTMRSMASGGAFHRAYRRGTQQAFLEGHELAFQHFGGGFQITISRRRNQISNSTSD